jgi:adenosylcobinamide-GDP ribazoletransferase
MPDIPQPTWPLREWRAFLSAVGFLSRAPLWRFATEASWREDLARSPRYFPLVGGLIGALTGAVFAGLCFILPPPVAAAVALGVEALATGAFHEDALADFADAFGGGTSRERTLDILKDSRIGAYGAVALIAAILLRWSSLSSIPLEQAIAAAAAAGAIGRLAVLAVMATLAPAGDRPSLAKDIGAQPSLPALLAGAAFAAPFIAWAATAQPLPTLIACAAALLAALILRRMMARKLGGSVGDGLGAVAMLGQTLALVAFTSRA